MDTKVLISALIGFFAGGLLVSTVATTIEKPADDSMSTTSAVEELKTKSGDDYDQAFITHMTAHHQSALEMAKLSADRAKHNEIKTLSDEIVKSQANEINQMNQWYTDWEYRTDKLDHDTNDHGH